MGNYLNCVSCVEREREGATQPLYSARSYDGSNNKEPEVEVAIDIAGDYCWKSSDEEEEAVQEGEATLESQPESSFEYPQVDLQDRINAIVKTSKTRIIETPEPVDPAKELQEHINAIVNTHAFIRHVPCSTENALKEQINAIVAAKVQERKAAAQSPVAYHTDRELQTQMNAIVKARVQEVQQPPPPSHTADTSLREQINSIVSTHAKSLKQQRLDCADEYVEWASPCSDWASPSPSKSMTDEDIAQHVNSVLSNARERTPGRSTLTDMDIAYHANAVLSNARERSTRAVPEELNLWAFEEELAPCQLNFAEADEGADESAKVEPQEVAALSPMKITIETEASEPAPAAPESSQESKKCEEEPKTFNIMEIPSPTRNRAKRQAALLAAAAKKEEEQPATKKEEEQQAAESLAEYHQKVVGEIEKTEEQLAEEQARLAEARRLREVAEMTAMDKLCVETFLDSVRNVSWRHKPRTPLKGTNLYTKHMRPCRPAGTSVDVKDSNFRSLGFFLEFLQSEGLLRLQPGLTDPVVTDINFAACAKYKYTSQFQPTVTAPQNAVQPRGCTGGLNWQ